MTATANQPKQTTLYYREGSSDKIYQASIEASGSPDHFLVRFAFGRRGSTLQTGTKTTTTVDYDTALRTFNQLVVSKLNKGYSYGEHSTPYQRTRNEGHSTGIYPQLLTAVEDEHALGHLLLAPLVCLQEKRDGKRLLLRKQNGVIEGINRRGLIVSVPETIVRAALLQPDSYLLDGEVVGDVFHVFDLLESGGRNHRAETYNDRLHHLNELLSIPSASIQPIFTARTTKEKITLLEKLRHGNREGVVLKHLLGVYSPGKTTGPMAPLKFKFEESARFVVNLVHHSKRSVSLGLFADPYSLVGAGNVTIPPNHEIPKPGAVVEVRYLYAFRQSGVIYQPVYLGEREDIEPSECTVSQLKYRHEPTVTIRV